MRAGEQSKAAKQFVDRWKDRGNERQDSQTFWLDLLETVYGIKQPGDYISFEDTVQLDNTSFIDAYIDSTKVMIEQKGKSKKLNVGIRQSDGALLNPFQQAQRYSMNLPYSKRPRWIVTCNFISFNVYDMEQPAGDPFVIQLKDLPKEYYRLNFLVDVANPHLEKEIKVSMQAGDLVGEMYDELKGQYIDSSNHRSQQSMNLLSVRIVFCLYAEDAGIFGKHSMFHDYLSEFDAAHVRTALIDLFSVLDTPYNKRSPYLEDSLAAFPYVNGGMFSERDIEIPQFTEHLRELILNDASDNFDWSQISPTIFGAVFESTLNPETRRQGGMHYTSIENIHKVIDPLFLDSLREDLNEIRKIKQPRVAQRRAAQFQDKLASLTFLDPACGSGNFLTETYLSIRKLENEAIKIIYDEKIQFALERQIIKVSIQQFHGIEINDFAVSVAKTALWIAESQMMEETKNIVYLNVNFLPLKSYTQIAEGNALLMNWRSLNGGNEFTYIFGNPPFVGKKEQTAEQKKDMKLVFAGHKIGSLDYVTAWYKKTAEILEDSMTRAAFVSTNSITQGEQVSTLWDELPDIEINFAWRTFKWGNEVKARSQAHVHVVIIGFSNKRASQNTSKFIYSNQIKTPAKRINAYLLDAKNILVKKRTRPICSVEECSYGSMPIDKNHLILNEDDLNQLIKENPQNAKFIRKYAGGEEIINNKQRWCLWLKGIDPKNYRNSKFIMNRIQLVKQFRESSNRDQTRKLADVPYLFGEIRQPNTDMLVIPKVSSQTRKYIPISYVHSDTIVNGSALIIPNASLYMFGVLTSNVHMAWVKTVAGRMKSDFQYSNQIVYNNFPWPKSPDTDMVKLVENTARDILTARSNHSDDSLAVIYDDSLMPADLRSAHQANDKAVMKLYGFPVSTTTENTAVVNLFKMYAKLSE